MSPVDRTAAFPKGSIRGLSRIFSRIMGIGVLCVLMVEQPMVASASGKKAQRLQPIQGDQRVLQVLNRFTFGPRPGDVEEIRKIGVKRWFDQQLKPAKIDDSLLDQRLAMFPAMQLQQADLMERYPAPKVLRQMMDKNMPLPTDPVEHAIYADEIGVYKAAKAKSEADQRNADRAAKVGNSVHAAEIKGNAALPGDRVDPATPAMVTHVEQLYSGLDAVKVINLPPQQRMKRVLAMSPDEVIAFRKGLTQSELAALAEGLTPLQKETLAALQGSSKMVESELLSSRMIRDVYSERQLEAVMTDFWLNHFNVYFNKDQNEPYLLPAFERDVIRPHALGKFEDLLVATAESPAMQRYLDNWQSIGPDSQAAQVQAGKPAPKDRGLNENYARELMELHTLGVQCEVSKDHPVSGLKKECGRGYTQQDVTQVAMVLTGWTIDRPDHGSEFKFEERRHEPGTKVVMGQKIKEKGEDEGLQVLHMLATSPATARFISEELAVRFVSDTPPPALVDRMEKTFVSSHGDIAKVLRAMFNSPEFWSTGVYRAKVKTPLEFVASAVRASGADISNAVPLTQSLGKLGMPLYGMQTPNGYSWTAESWINTGDLINRMNFALGLSDNRISGAQINWMRLLDSPTVKLEPVALSADGAGAGGLAMKERELEMLLLHQPVSDRTRATVLQQFQVQTTQQQAEKHFAIRTKDADPMAAVLNAGASAGAAPGAQGHQAAVIAGLLLGSPEFQRR